MLIFLHFWPAVQAARESRQAKDMGEWHYGISKDEGLLYSLILGLVNSTVGIHLSMFLAKEVSLEMLPPRELPL